MKKAAMAACLVLLVSFPATGFAAHQVEKAAPKGTVTKITVSEYEVTIKDEKGKETKVKVKEISDVVVGDSVIVTNGALKKAVKPKTGGY
jgi:ABC-type enterochelin transport system substrate-binding protein